MILNLLAEPVGRDYCALLTAGQAVCDEVSLVVRPGISLSPNGEKLLIQLESFILQVGEKSEWPGTRLLQETATVYRFKFSSRCAEILSSAASGLYSWVQPDLPEDLCLIRPSGDAWLVSITHERDAYLDITPDERNLLLEKVPALELSSDVQLNNEGASVN